MGMAGAVQSSSSRDRQPPFMDVPGGISAVSKKGIKDGWQRLSPLLFPSIPGYNHIPSQYVDYYAMIQEPGENDPSKFLLWGDRAGNARQDQPAPLGAHCSTAAGELQVCRRMASADVNSPLPYPPPPLLPPPAHRSLCCCCRST